MQQLFATQIYQKKIQFDLKDLAKEIHQISTADVAGQKWSSKNYQNGYTSYGSWDQMHKMSSTFRDLEKKIDKHVQALIKNLDFEIDKKALKMDSCWVNIMPPGAQHTSHLHPNSVISGTFYVAIPAKSSAIKFEDPRLGLFMNAPTVKLSGRKENQRFFSLDPKAGDVVLFESWLKHEVPRNESKKPRISVSFNYGWN
ncbi:MAG: hypothetical protein H7328_08495 [Bdellovibrio sp.]|nr:hypothetical protein [Bdellovibrio sp.]